MNKGVCKGIKNEKSIYILLFFYVYSANEIYNFLEYSGASNDSLGIQPSTKGSFLGQSDGDSYQKLETKISGNKYNLKPLLSPLNWSVFHWKGRKYQTGISKYTSISNQEEDLIYEDSENANNHI